MSKEVKMYVLNVNIAHNFVMFSSPSSSRGAGLPSFSRPLSFPFFLFCLIVCLWDFNHITLKGWLKLQVLKLPYSEQGCKPYQLRARSPKLCRNFQKGKFLKSVLLRSKNSWHEKGHHTKRFSVYLEIIDRLHLSISDFVISRMALIRL